MTHWYDQAKGESLQCVAKSRCALDLRRVAVCARGQGLRPAVVNKHVYVRPTGRTIHAMRGAEGEPSRMEGLDLDLEIRGD